MNFGFRLQHSHSVQGLLGGPFAMAEGVPEAMAKTT